MNVSFLEKLFQYQEGFPKNFFLIAGPCVVENEDICFQIAEKIKTITSTLNIPYIFKASYRKANRTNIDSFTGLGDENALQIIARVGKKYNLPTITDIHNLEEAIIAAKYVDILQIPAFLCRQTDLLLAAAKTAKIINIKKGQFLSGEAMKFAVQKLKQGGNLNIMLTDRGNSFGYQDIIVDYRNIPIMQKNNVPVIVDCTHSLQQPNQTSGVTGGNPLFIETIAKAAIAVGADGIFIETHPNPKEAKSDGANMLPIELLENLLKKLVSIRQVL
ncbi:MAG: 3-deoxy-8-phosphooctulonate synthase [Chitinophagaceae bacterium]